MNDSLNCNAILRPDRPEHRSPPLFSYVVATLNCINLVPTLARSAQIMAGLRCEICVMDGGSIDGTWQALQALPALPQLRLLGSAPDRGIYDAWNRALPQVRGRYVGFLGADDEPMPEFLAEAAAVLAASARPGGRAAPGLLYGDVCMQRQGRVRRLVAPAHLRLLNEQLPVFDLFHPGSLIRADLLSGANTFDADFKLAGDFEFFVRHAARLRQAGTRRLRALQAQLKDEGLSRRPAALALYARELARIEAQSDRRLGHGGTAFPWLAALARWPWLFDRCKDLSWAMRSKPLALPSAALSCAGSSSAAPSGP